MCVFVDASPVIMQTTFPSVCNLKSLQQQQRRGNSCLSKSTKSHHYSVLSFGQRIYLAMLQVSSNGKAFHYPWQIKKKNIALSSYQSCLTWLLFLQLLWLLISAAPYDCLFCLCSYSNATIWFGPLRRQLLYITTPAVTCVFVSAKMPLLPESKIRLTNGEDIDDLSMNSL